MTRIARKTISAIDMTFTGINLDKPPSVHSRSQIDKPTKDTIESLEVRPPPPSKWQISRAHPLIANNLLPWICSHYFLWQQLDPVP